MLSFLLNHPKHKDQIYRPYEAPCASGESLVMFGIIVFFRMFWETQAMKWIRYSSSRLHMTYSHIICEYHINLCKEQIVFLSCSVSRINCNLSWKFWSSSNLFKQNNSTPKIHLFHQIFHPFHPPWSQIHVNRVKYFTLKLEGISKYEQSIYILV